MFCKLHPQKLNHLYSCPCSRAFSDYSGLFWFSGSQMTINLTQQDVTAGVLSMLRPLLNYFLLIAEIYLWDCRRNQTHQNINSFKTSILVKYQTENSVGRFNKMMEFLRLKRANFQLPVILVNFSLSCNKF